MTEIVMRLYDFKSINRKINAIEDDIVKLQNNHRKKIENDD
jgi:hypothetical protein